MKLSRIFLVAIPAGVFALGAVALGKWSFRSIFAPSSTARAGSATRMTADVATDIDGPRTIAGSPEEVAEVAEAMAEEGGAVLVTEVTPIAEGETLVTETLLVPDPKPS